MPYALIRRFSTLAILVLVAAACSGGGGGPTVGPASAPPATGAAATSAASTPTATSASTAAPATAAATSAPTAAATSAAATPGGSTGDLVAIIPAEIGGITGDVRGYTGQEYVDTASGGNEEAAQVLLDQFATYGASVDDVSVATGDYYSDDDYVRISAMRIAGADGAAFLDTWVQNLIDSAPEFNSGMSASSADATVGGKPVKVVTTMLGGSEYDKQYIYGNGDTVVTVVGGSDELIEEALSLLP